MYKYISNYRLEVREIIVEKSASRIVYRYSFRILYSVLTYCTKLTCQHVELSVTTSCQIFILFVPSLHSTFPLHHSSFIVRFSAAQSGPKQRRKMTEPILNIASCVVNTGTLVSPQPDQEGNKLGIMSGTRAVSTTSRREMSKSFLFLQGKAPKEIHVILTETLACFLPGRAKDLSAPLYGSEDKTFYHA